MARQDSFDAPVRRLPTLEELLADDVTQAVMRADHVATREVRGLCEAVGVLLHQRAGWKLAGHRSI